MNFSSTAPTTTAKKPRQARYKPQPPKDPSLFSTQEEWDTQHELERTNPWHHLPLALVALPPLLSIIHGRAENWSDAILLLLVAFYLYQLVKVPWEMYYASNSRTVLPDPVTRDGTEQDEDPALTRQRHASASLLRRNELVALAATALVPAVGAYLLHYVRGLLSDPDRYINPTLINMFSIATSVKPFLHFVHLIKHQSLYHQEIVHYPSTRVHVLSQRVEKLENDLVQLSRAFATKSDVRALRDGVDVPLSQLSKAVKRFNRKEEYLRLTSEEQFVVLSQRIDELDEQNEARRRKEIEDRERDERLMQQKRKGANESDFVRFVGNLLGHVIAVPVYGNRSPSSSDQDSKMKKHAVIEDARIGGGGGGRKKKQKELGWYERGITWYLFWPVTVPKSALGWAVELVGTAVRGIEEGYVEEKEIKFATAGAAPSPPLLSSSTTGTKHSASTTNPTIGGKRTRIYQHHNGAR